MSFSTCLSPFNLQPQALLLTMIRHDHANIQFAIANRSTVRFKSNINITFSALFPSLSCTPCIVLTMDLSVLHKIPMSLSSNHHASLRLMAIQTDPISVIENLPHSSSPHSQNITYPHIVQVITEASHPPPAHNLSLRYINSLTASTQSHNVSSCLTAIAIFF